MIFLLALRGKNRPDVGSGSRSPPSRVTVEGTGLICSHVLYYVIMLGNTCMHDVDSALLKSNFKKKKTKKPCKAVGSEI